MKIAIDVSPLQTGHKVRGVGFYLSHLKDALVKYFPDNEYLFFTDRKGPSGNIDLIHYPYFDPFFISLPTIERYKRVVTVHDLTPLVFPDHFPAGIKGNISWQIQKLNLRNSHAIITDSHASSNDVMKYTGVAKKKIQSVYLAAGEEFQVIKSSSYKVIKKYGLPEKYVLYVGDVTWNKNLPRLIEAVKEADVPLVMVGKAITQKDFDKANPWNRDLITAQALTDDDKRFIKLGFVDTDELVELYNVATAFVFPSLYEGFGLPVLEAMQSGCPVITTKEGSLAEVAGDAAYFVNAYNTDSIAKGISEVFHSKKLQDQLREKGLEQAKKFSWKKTAEETIAVYEKVIGDRV